MRLPTDERERHKLYRNLIRECEISREDRRTRNAGLRDLYLYGNTRGELSTYNSLREYVETSSAYIYGDESVSFGIDLPGKHGTEFLEEQEVLREELQRMWHNPYGGYGKVAAQCVKWAHIFPSVVSKTVVVDGKPAVEMLQDPADFGVWQEDVPDLDKQEVMVHWYRSDLPRFKRILWNLPNLSAAERDEYYEAAKGRAGPQADSRSGTLGSAVDRLLIASASPTMVGAVQNMLTSPMAQARVDADVIELAELWIKDDELKDWRVVTTFLSEEYVISEMPNPLVPGLHPFDLLVLEDATGYLWGISMVSLLAGLQMWRERRMAQIDNLLGLQAKPPRFFRGFTGIKEEQQRALNSPNGFISNPLPQSAVEDMSPKMPPDAFAEVNEIDRMEGRQGGLPQLLQGQGEAGLRAGNQTGVLATLGSARLLRKAMMVEGWLSRVATKVVRLYQLNSKDKLKKPDGEDFLPSQVPADLVAKVSAHSASPLYAEQIVQKAVVAKTTDPACLSSEDFLQLLGLPMGELLKVKAQRREASMMETKKALAEVEIKGKDAKAQKDLATAGYEQRRD